MFHQGKRISPWCSVAVWGVLLTGPSAEAAEPLIRLGPKSALVLNQPRVGVTIVDQDQMPLGPNSNSFLLDTGSNFNLVFRRATTELSAAGYETEGTYDEKGVAGTQSFDVSAPYRLDFTGSDGSGGSLADVRILSSDALEVDPTGLLGLHGIVGMTAMVGRVTTLDNTLSTGGLLSFTTYTRFFDQLPADSGHRYSVDLTTVDFPPQGEPPLPTGAPLPMLQARVVDGCAARTAGFLLDTGAQFSIISTPVALDLGLDRNGNGTIADEALGSLPVGGIGGTVNAPLVRVPELRVPTREGPELVWSDVDVLVVDIDPHIEAVLGSDVLGSGDGGLLGITDPYIRQIHMDFRDLLTGGGQLLLDLAPARDNVLASTPVAVGDADNNGSVGPSDLEILVGNWGREVVSGGACGDFNQDRQVDITDLVMLAGAWNFQPGATPLRVDSVLRMVPEPAIAAGGNRLVGLALFLLFGWFADALHFSGHRRRSSGCLPGDGLLQPVGNPAD
jgi:hypothetical protein